MKNIKKNMFIQDIQDEEPLSQQDNILGYIIITVVSFIIWFVYIISNYNIIFTPTTEKVRIRINKLIKKIRINKLIKKIRDNKIIKKIRKNKIIKKIRKNKIIKKIRKNKR